MKQLYKTGGDNLFSCGKVRDIYQMDDGEHLAIITTDRISVFDHVFPNPIPGKGIYLNRLTNFWLDYLEVPNHRVSMADISSENMDDLLSMDLELQDRVMIVRKAEPFPVEVVIRGYLVGSGWKEYKEYGTVCGVELPKGLKNGSLITGSPILTPAKKGKPGEYENISPRAAAKIVGKHWDRIVEMSFGIYKKAAKYADEKGIIIADTKLEFGLVDDEVILIDEVLTPDSSSFWDKSEYKVGNIQLSYDKQYIRDWLIGTGWRGGKELPEIPEYIVESTIDKYSSLFSTLTA